MQIRRLEPKEHERTRHLYETVFAEDAKEFVDYYYTWKTKDSCIYVAGDEDGIHAMVHLNPFTVSVHGKLQKLHYIVAVATQEEYRHRGLMRELLQAAEQEMKRNKEAFTFLMPASEKIYAPFGYRFFAWQRKGIWRAERGVGDGGRERPYIEAGRQEVLVAGGEFAERSAGDSREAVFRSIHNPGKNFTEAVCRPVRPQEYGALAQFVNDTLSGQYEVFIYRDAAYYERLCAEQRCQGGAVMVIAEMQAERAGRQRNGGTLPESGQQAAGKRGRIIGTFCTAKEEPGSEFAAEIRELILAEERLEEARRAVQAFVNACGDCRVAGCQPPVALDHEALVPLLMGKSPGGGAFISPWPAGQVFINEVV